jgi:dipeptidyl aminopeptidase/acylaminoacyl peptidase
MSHNDVPDRGPSFSGNGQRIAFTSSCDGGADDDIFVMKANGKDETQVTTGTEASDDDYGADLSPDGARIAFVSARDDGDDHIFVMRASGMVSREGRRAGPVRFEPTASLADSAPPLCVRRIRARPTKAASLEARSVRRGRRRRRTW